MRVWATVLFTLYQQIQSFGIGVLPRHIGFICPFIKWVVTEAVHFVYSNEILCVLRYLNQIGQVQEVKNCRQETV